MNDEIPYNPPGMTEYIREGARKNSALLRKMQGQPEPIATAETKHVCISDLLADSPTWPHVLAFALRMEAKLAKNRHKGDRKGWLKDNPWNLVERILDETVELQQCFSTDGAGAGVWLLKTPEETADECADVANFCMMVADRVTSQESANAPGELPGATTQK